MESFTALDLEGITVALRNHTESHYDLSLNRSDLETLLRVLHNSATHVSGDETLYHASFDFLSGILSTLGVEYI